jgi:hypothetical protein
LFYQGPSPHPTYQQGALTHEWTEQDTTTATTTNNNNNAFYLWAPFLTLKVTFNKSNIHKSKQKTSTTT